MMGLVPPARIHGETARRGAVAPGVDAGFTLCFIVGAGRKHADILGQSWSIRVVAAVAVQDHRGTAGRSVEAVQDGLVRHILLDLHREALLVGGLPHLDAVLSAILVQRHRRLGAIGGSAGEFDSSGVGRQRRDAGADAVIGRGGAAVQV